METWLRRNEHSIKVAAAFLASMFALIQYLGHLKEISVEKSLVFFERFSKEPIFPARTRILERWESLGASLAELPTPANREEAVAQRRIWKGTVVSAIKGNSQFSVDTDIMLDFFDALQVCVENNICYEKSAHELMEGSARTFFGNNCAYVAYVRLDQKVTKFGAKTEAFAKFPCHLDIYSELLPNPRVQGTPRDKAAQRP
jgi:hypothetical protein